MNSRTKYWRDLFVASFVGWLASVVMNPVQAYLYALAIALSDNYEIDFQAVGGCPSGRLWKIQSHFASEAGLVNGADRLTICDTDKLLTTNAEAPRDLANRYPGCLRWRAGELVLLRKSAAVCALLDESGYVCDGANARLPLGSEAALASAPVSPCSPEVLRRFGFAG